jgi:PAS domain S-box-containing protein
MKISGLILSLVLLTFIAFSAELKEETGRRNLTTGIDSMNKLAEMSLESNSDLTKSLVNEALIQSNQIKYSKGKIEALTSLAKYYLIKEDYVKTLECYFTMIDMYDQNRDVEALVYRYTRVVSLFLLIKDYDLAEKYLSIISRIVQKTQDPTSHAQTYLFWAKYYHAKGEYDLAIRNLYLCIPFVQKNHDLGSEGAVYKFIGDALVQKKMYAQADYTYHIAISFYSRIADHDEIAITYTRLAHIYNVLNNNKLNLSFNLAAMRIREKSGQAFFVSSSYLNVGEAYWLLGKKDSARYYLQKSLKLAEHIKKTDLLEAINSQLTDFAIAEKRYSDALNYFRTTIKYRTKMNQDRNRSEILTLEANRTIRANEADNDLLNQEMLLQTLEIRNQRVQILLFEVTFLIILSLILFVDTLARKNQKRKAELKDLNSRLSREINVRIEAERRLTRSEELHRFLAENTVDVISLLDANLNRLYISPSCEKFYDFTTLEILQLRSHLDLVEPSFHALVNQKLNEMFHSKNSTSYIYKVRKKDSSTFWAEATINPILDTTTHEITRLITVVRDISERVKHEEELAENARQKEYLLHEIHNRVKNNFSILISLMNMQQVQSANPELSSSLTDLQLRVRAMSLVHEQLYKTQEISFVPFDIYLHHLATIISSSFRNSRIRIHTEIHTCKVPISMALPLGLIINELITNAYKYAFPDNLAGNIWVRLLPEYEEKFFISICDDGIGLPANFTMNKAQTMGSQIIEILLEQIEATIEISSNRGACFRVIFSSTQEI